MKKFWDNLMSNMPWNSTKQTMLFPDPFDVPNYTHAATGMDFWIMMLYANGNTPNTERPKMDDIIHILDTDSMGASIRRHDRYRVVGFDTTKNGQPLVLIEDVITGEVGKENIRMLNHLEGHLRHWIRVT